MVNNRINEFMNKRRKFLAVSLLVSVIFFTFFFIFIAQPGVEVNAEEPSVPTVRKVAESVSKFDLSSRFPEWTQKDVLGVNVWQFLAAFVFILLGLILKKISDFIFKRKLIPLFEKTRFSFDNLLTTAISKPLGYLLFIGGIAGAFAVLSLPEEPNVRDFAFGILKIFVVADFLWFLLRLVDVGVHYLAQLAERTESKLDDELIPLVRKALKATIGVICLLWLIQLLGYNVSSLLAGLGIGGLAVALALQDTLANFFGSIFIYLDRPFMVGDWIKLGDVEGKVEDIGFRSTRIRTWPATLVSIPNKTVASSTIDNWSKMPKRRVVQTVGVTYKTTPEQMERAVSAIKDIIENDEGVDKEFYVVRFTDFGDSSLNILVYYFTKDVGFASHLETKQRINLAIMCALRDLGLSIAFPSHTVYFEGQIAKDMAKRTGSSKESKKQNQKDL